MRNYDETSLITYHSQTREHQSFILQLYKLYDFCKQIYLFIMEDVRHTVGHIYVRNKPAVSGEHKHSWMAVWGQTKMVFCVQLLHALLMGYIGAWVALSSTSVSITPSNLVQHSRLLVADIVKLCESAWVWIEQMAP